MVAVLTQNSAIINLDKITTISVIKDENDKIAIVADQTYVLGYYNTEKDAATVITWISNTIGTYTNDNNISIAMPLANSLNDSSESEEINAENG